MNTSYKSCHNYKSVNTKSRDANDNISDVVNYKRKEVRCYVIVIAVLLVLSSSYLFSYYASPLYGHLSSGDYDHYSNYHTIYSKQSSKVQHVGYATYYLNNQSFNAHKYPLSHRISSSGSIVPTAFLQNNSPINSSALSSPRIDVTSLAPSTSPSTNVSSALRIAAGKIQDISFAINSKNDSNSPTTLGGSNTRSITDLSVTLASQSNSVRILGKSQWNLPILNSQSQQVLSTKVFASTPLIGSPVFFTVTAQYIRNGLELKSESFSLGAIVVGDIKIGVNNLNIRYVGDTPNLVGNLLNEGNTPALFSNIEMLSSSNSFSTNTGQHDSLLTNRSSASSLSISNDSYRKGDNMNGTNLTSPVFKVGLRPLSSQYIGNLPVNNPIPFNIPLQIINTDLHAKGSPIARSGTGADFFGTLYPLSLKITYTDDLKETRELILNKTVSIQPVTATLASTVTTNNGQLSSGSRERVSQTQQQEPPTTGIISPVNNGFVDAYWADRSSDLTTSPTNNTVSLASTSTSPSQIPQLVKEVGPGEGNSILAVVLSNTGVSDITGLIGYLTLPDGFSAVIPGGSLPMTTSPRSNSANLNHENRPAIASLNGIIKAGQTYTLYFKVNVLDIAKVGLHEASVQISYFRVPEPEAGTYRTQTISVPFMLPGKVILDAMSSTNVLAPGEVNNIMINLKNKGTADASSVVATIVRTGNSIVTDGKGNFEQPNSSGTDIQNDNNSSSRDGISNNAMINSQPKPSSSSSSTRSTLNLGARTFNIGTIPFNKSANISTTIYPSNEAGGTLQDLDLDITYSDSNGITRSTMISLGLRIAPTPPEAGISVSPSSYSPFSKPTFMPASNGLNYGIGSSDKPVTGHLIPASILKTKDNSVNINSSTASNHITIVAGKVDDLRFDLNNNNNRPITDVVIGLTSETASMKILGSSKWSLGMINPHGSNQFLTKVFASKSLIGTPVSFNISVRYIYNEQAKSDSFNLGANVVGDIRVAVNDLDINFIGGTPNLVGNLLNRGNTMGLFTTVQIMNRSEDSLQEPANNKVLNSDRSNNIKEKRVLVPVSLSPQYLGDLQDNSPLPFSIPLALDNSSGRGIYPVALKITYSDDLKNLHSVLLNGTVRFNPHIQTSSSNNSGFYGILISIIILASLAAVAVFVIKRIKKWKRRGKGDRASRKKNNITRSDEGYSVDTDIARSDIETLLDGGQLKPNSDDDKVKG